MSNEPAPPTPEPSDDQPIKPKKPRGARKRVLGDGEGDYCIYEIVGKDQKMPAGAMMPIPKVPRFEDTQSAMKWIRNESKDLLTGKQVMIFRACEILSLVIETKPQVKIQSKPKISVATQEVSDG